MPTDPAPQSDAASVQPVILVVEDEVLVRLAIADYLRDCGYRVLEAASGDEAVSVLASADLAVDVVFSDVQMPGTRDGFALAHWVRKNRPGVRVVLTSGWAGAAAKAGELCHDGPMVTKPYDHAAVLRWIREMLGRAKD